MLFQVGNRPHSRLCVLRISLLGCPAGNLAALRQHSLRWFLPLNRASSQAEDHLFNLPNSQLRYHPGSQLHCLLGSHRMLQVFSRVHSRAHNQACSHPLILVGNHLLCPADNQVDSLQVRLLSNQAVNLVLRPVVSRPCLPQDSLRSSHPDCPQYSRHPDHLRNPQACQRGSLLVVQVRSPRRSHQHNLVDSLLVFLPFSLVQGPLASRAHVLRHIPARNRAISQLGGRQRSLRVSLPRLLPGSRLPSLRSNQTADPVHNQAQGLRGSLAVCQAVSQVQCPAFSLARNQCCVPQASHLCSPPAGHPAIWR